MTLNNRGRSKKTEGWTGPKNKGGSLAVGTYLHRGSGPPPPGWGLRPPGGRGARALGGPGR